MTDPDVGAKPSRPCSTARRPPTSSPELVQRRLEHLPEAVAESTGYKGPARHPGAAEQLSRDGHLLGLITMNGDGAACTKLTRGDLVRWFTFGAYAGAGLDRAGIVRQAVARGEAMLGSDVPNSQIYVIGDTPLDIEAAHTIECRAIAVATGHCDVDALRAAGADEVLETLEHELPLD